MLWYFLIVVALVALVFATFVDIKIREVPDWLNFSLVAIGLGSRLIYSLISSDYSYILYGLLGFSVFFSLANIMYYTKQWGGGDSKLLMGLGTMFGNYDKFSILGYEYNLPFLAVLIINIFIAGTLYGIIYSVFLGLKHKKNFIKEFKNRNFNSLKIAFCFVVVFGAISFLIFDSWLSGLIIWLLLVLFVAYAILFFMKIVEDAALYKMIDVKKLTIGDWLAKDVIVGKKVICHMRNIGLMAEDIKSLKKNKVKNVLIRQGIPFVPGFLIGFLATIFIGDLMVFFF